MFTKTHAVKQIFTKITLSITACFRETQAYCHRTDFHKKPRCQNRFSRKLLLLSQPIFVKLKLTATEPIFTKPTPSQKPIFTKLELTVTEPIFTKLTLARHSSEKILIYYILKSLTDRLLVGVRLQTDRQRQGLQLCPQIFLTS
jgi:hypothetical protein